MTHLAGLSRFAALTPLVWFSLALVLSSNSAAQASSERHSERQTLVFSTIRPGALDLYELDGEGGVRQLTDHPAIDYNPALSPDGRWLVFTSERDGSADLWALPMEVDAEPAAPRKLTHGPALDDAASFSPDGRTLVFVSTRSGRSEIHTMPFRPDAPAPAIEARSLTPDAGGNFNPVFSPDGTKIAFSSNRDIVARGRMPAGEGSHVYVMNSNGSNVERLTHHSGWSWSGMPVFSADGRSVYYQHVTFDQFTPASAVIRSVGVEGGEVVAITDETRLSAWPAMDADGQLVFAGQRDGRWRILAQGGEGEHSVGRHGFDLQAPSVAAGRIVAQGPGLQVAHGFVQLPLPGGSHPFRAADRVSSVHLGSAESSMSRIDLQLLPVRHPFASPDPTHRRWATSGVALAVSDLDGNGYEIIHEGPPDPFSIAVWGAKWSPDGSRLAVSLGPAFAPVEAPVDIWSVRPDGSDPRNLTADSPGNDGFPAYSPDGRHLVFRSGRSGNHEIYRMDSDGGNVRQLTDHEANDTMPSYSPDGGEIAFASLRDGDFEIYTLAVGKDGEPGTLRRITYSPGFDMHPHFSPDGRWLVVTTSRYGMNDERPLDFVPQPYGELVAIRLADLHVVRLTHTKWEDGLGVWLEERPESLLGLGQVAEIR